MNKHEYVSNITDNKKQFERLSNSKKWKPGNSLHEYLRASLAITMQCLRGGGGGGSHKCCLSRAMCK